MWEKLVTGRVVEIMQVLAGDLRATRGPQFERYRLYESVTRGIGQNFPSSHHDASLLQLGLFACVWAACPKPCRAVHPRGQSKHQPTVYQALLFT